MKVNTGLGLGMGCTKTCFFKGRRVKNSTCTCQKHDGVGMATWLCQSIVAAFFASLECCSCFYVDTTDATDCDSTSSPLFLNAEKDDYVVPNSLTTI
ncbi:hypothetical protein CR513_49846, partial [Mucuna pruriens]